MTLYLLGGAPRCGKTQLAQRLARAHGIGWASTDMLREVVAVAMPELYEPWGADDDPGLQAELLYPYLERFCREATSICDGYLVEGFCMLPRHAARAARTITDVRAVFVGVSRITVEDIRAHARHNLWHERLEPAALADLPRWIVHWSERIRAEAHQHALPFVDLAPDFAAGQAEAARLLS